MKQSIEAGLSFTIREARAEDAPHLAQAEREIAEIPGFLVSKPFELTNERFVNKITELSSMRNGKYLVAEKDGQILGHAMLDPLPLTAIQHVVHLTLAVHPGWERKGIGKALLRTLIEWARNESSVEKIELHVRSQNIPAQNLYRKLGFTEEGRWKRRVKIKEGEYLDDVLMGLWVGNNYEK